MNPPPPVQLVRRRVQLGGIVQGVGFRPFVHALAREHRLTGMVRNCGGAVEIEVQGAEADVGAFVGQLNRRAPPTARVDDLTVEVVAPHHEAEFKIADSAEAAREIAFAPDVATCADCLADIDDASGRWFNYPFTSCTVCGPRFTLMNAAPYDRARTSMAAFALCPLCKVDYADPTSRRFHAQTIACPACGPTLTLRSAAGERLAVADPLAQAAEWVRDGKIGAVKGVGGYHVFCDATNPVPVEELRRRKRRGDKPLAIMAATLADAARWCEIGPEEERWLTSPARPIVLLRNKPAQALASAVSAGLPYTGVMLPYSGVHHLLLRKLNGVPLVMTSGNAADEPTAFRDHHARTSLGKFVDFFLSHDREIVSRCDDSVVRLAGTMPILIRRSRGYAPAPLRIARELKVPTLAVGGQMKATFALGSGNRAVLSHHLGDLENVETLLDYERTVARYERLFGITPQVLVHDAHPDYASTRYAVGRARRESLRTLAVQHHHAHFASCLADHGAVGPAIGVCFDGTGYGLDAAVWGGEFLIGDCSRVARAAHLRYVRMPGGERAIHEPWRMAAVYLAEAGYPPEEWLQATPVRQIRTVAHAVARHINAPQTSSVGRFFDAMAALLGVRRAVSYEGQAAMELEALAMSAAGDGAYDFAITEAEPLELDLRPTVRDVVADLRRGADKSAIARRIHGTLALAVETLCRRLAARGSLNTVALSGGVFMNALLLQQTTARLERVGFRVLRHTRVPANDGGICLGQLAVAAALEIDRQSR